jgi:hypothetical protein
MACLPIQSIRTACHQQSCGSSRAGWATACLLACRRDLACHGRCMPPTSKDGCMSPVLHRIALHCIASAWRTGSPSAMLALHAWHARPWF